jgi:hypothetical protein
MQGPEEASRLIQHWAAHCSLFCRNTKSPHPVRITFTSPISSDPYSSLERLWHTFFDLCSCSCSCSRSRRSNTDHRRRPSEALTPFQRSSSSYPAHPDRLKRQPTKMSNGKTPVVAEAHQVDTFRKMLNWLPVARKWTLMTDNGINRPSTKDAG